MNGSTHHTCAESQTVTATSNHIWFGKMNYDITMFGAPTGIEGGREDAVLND